jgi:hypothetical protein
MFWRGSFGSRKLLRILKKSMYVCKIYKWTILHHGCSAMYGDRREGYWVAVEELMVGEAYCAVGDDSHSAHGYSIERIN